MFYFIVIHAGQHFLAIVLDVFLPWTAPLCLVNKNKSTVIRCGIKMMRVYLYVCYFAALRMRRNGTSHSIYTYPRVG